jgi:glutamate 5-kinase
VLVTSADLVGEALAGGQVGTWFAPSPAPLSTPATGPVGVRR